MAKNKIKCNPTQLFMNFDELVIDNFAGGGGASTGIEQAIGRPVDIAINHDPEALAMHAANHPHTRHICESVWDVNPLEVTCGRPVGLVHLSPDCKHFSRAKGSTPVEKKIRGLAWVGLRWLALTRPRILELENVCEFVTWGPLVNNGNGKMKPCPKNKGREFNIFVNAIRRHGYHVEWRAMKGSDYGAPTTRTRLFLVARRDGLPVVWPAPTHADPKSEAVRRGSLHPWRTAAECIDWSIPCPSIFERKRPLVDNTCRRIAKGIMRYVVNNNDPFIVRIGQTGGSGAYSRDIHAPLSTIVSKNEHLLVRPFISRQFGQGVGSDVSEPIGTVTAGGMGKSALCTAFLAKHYTGVVGMPVDSPLHTITAHDHHSVVTSNLIKLRGDNVGQPVDQPLRTITAGGNHHAEVRAFLIKYYGTGGKTEMAKPMPTVTTRGKFGLVTVFGESYQIIDIGMRMLQPRELFRAQGFPDDYIIGDDPEQGLKLTKSAQVRMCGNSVCPDIARALVGANYKIEDEKISCSA